MSRLVLAALILSPAPASGAAARDFIFETDPLEVTVPRLRSTKPIDPQINQHLLRLLQSRADARPASQEAQDASLGNLIRLTTTTGYKLKTRYTELGFLLTEGLAGVKDLMLAAEVERVAKLGKNVQTRAAAMVALAYAKDRQYAPLFQSALQDPNVTVRFAAVESLLIMEDPGAKFLITNAARQDLSGAVRVYAAAGMWRSGDPDGREILLRHYQDQDWLVRAMAIRYLGEMGGAEDYRKLLIELSREQHATVKAELAAALLRLHPKKDG